jgi:hypothetical protein
MSLNIYAALALRENAIKAGTATRRISLSNNFPPKKGAAKRKRFLTQCFERRR